LASLLDSQGLEARIVGLDASVELVKRARARAEELQHVQAEYAVSDLAEGGWSSRLPAILFDRVLALALLHHIPGFCHRVALVEEAATPLAPAGKLIISTWQFMNSARLRRKIQPWDEVGIDGDALEPGDYLLDWRRGGRGLRYCHLIDEAEMQRLAAASGLRIHELFHAGGREGNLSLFAVMGRPA
jgi:2-polyprenyl-3-methyl-5-hydroxy-6-metoxy-1,4-benzoquinol methylase